MFCLFVFLFFSLIFYNSVFFFQFSLFIGRRTNILVYRFENFTWYIYFHLEKQNDSNYWIIIENGCFAFCLSCTRKKRFFNLRWTNLNAWDFFSFLFFSFYIHSLLWPKIKCWRRRFWMENDWRKLQLNFLFRIISSQFHCMSMFWGILNGERDWRWNELREKKNKQLVVT